MNLTATIKYSLRSSAKIISPFYLTLIGLSVLFFFLIQGQAHTTGSLGAWDAFAIFACTGVATNFKERFHFFIQNGYSRKTLYINFLISFICVALFVSAFDALMKLMNDNGMINYLSCFTSLYEAISPSMFTEILWHITVAMMVFMIAFFLTIAFYRLSKAYRIFFFMILPAILIIGLPMLQIIFPSFTVVQNIMMGGLWYLGIYGTMDPYITIKCSVVVMIIFAVLSYLELRKASIQKV